MGILPRRPRDCLGFVLHKESIHIHEISRRGSKLVMTDLRDTLLVLATVQNSPSDPAGVLALEEERLGLAVLEAEDLGVPADVDLTL